MFESPLYIYKYEKLLHQIGVAIVIWLLSAFNEGFQKKKKKSESSETPL